MTMKRTFEIIMVVAGSLVAGCGGGNGNACVPGMSTACACSDGTQGAQVCRGDGTYGACQCAGGPNGGNGMPMGGGGAGGGGGGAAGSNGNGGGGSGGGGSGGGGGGGGSSSGSKRVFITSTLYTGPVAASICNTVAQAAGLSGTWKPWLSFGSSTPITDAIDAIKGTGPWVMLDGTTAFANHAQLATQPSAAIVVTEKMTRVPSTDDSVWTGTVNGGLHSGYDCNDWASAGYTGSLGHAADLATWTQGGGGNYSCSSNARVYCFEQ